MYLWSQRRSLSAQLELLASEEAEGSVCSHKSWESVAAFQVKGMEALWGSSMLYEDTKMLPVQVTTNIKASIILMLVGVLVTFLITETEVTYRRRH